MATTTTSTESKSSRVVALYQHPQRSFKKSEPPIPMLPVSKLTMVAGKGIVGSRFYGKGRHVTLIELELIERYEKLLDMKITWDMLRSNMIISGFDLIQTLIAWLRCSNMATAFEDDIAQVYDSHEVKRIIVHQEIDIAIGKTVVLRFYQLREPCWKMNLIHDGLERLMWGQDVNDERQDVQGSGHLAQGMICQVVEGGEVCIGDDIRLLSKSNKTETAN